MNLRNLLILLLFQQQLIFADTNYTSYVDPLIGTGVPGLDEDADYGGGDGAVHPGPTLPFGMVSFSP